MVNKLCIHLEEYREILRVGLHIPKQYDSCRTCDGTRRCENFKQDLMSKSDLDRYCDTSRRVYEEWGAGRK